MKKSIIFLLGSIFATVAFTGCSVEDNGIPESTPASDVKVVASGFMKIEKTGTTGEDVDEPGGVTVTQMTEEEVKAEQKKLMADDSGSSGVYWYAWTTITYRCMTADGSQKDLSELLVWPCTYFNWEPDQLVIGCHSTITSNAECPTNFSNLPNAGEINMLALFANAFSQEALVIVPATKVTVLLPAIPILTATVNSLPSRWWKESRPDSPILRRI